MAQKVYKQDVSDEELQVARRMFIIGCFCLPLVWFFNIIVFRDSYKNPNKNGKQLHKYFMYSLWGFIAWTVVFIGWNLFFQLGYPTISWLNNFHLVYPDGIGWA
ncbi:hypothetical protein WA158_005189 [Blastocystis sp. Blastoise]